MKIAGNDRVLFESQIAAYAHDAWYKRDYAQAVQLYGRMCQIAGDERPFPNKYLSNFRDFLAVQAHENSIRARARYLGEYATGHFNEIALDNHNPDVSYIGEGGLSDVWHLIKKGLIIKRGWHSSDTDRSELSIAYDMLAIDQSIVTGDRATGQKHFQQLVAASYDNKKSVHKYVEGKDLRRVGRRERQSISDEHYAALLSTIIKADQLEILGDIKDRNIIFHPDDGFTVIDMMCNRENWETLDYILSKLPKNVVARLPISSPPVDNSTRS